MLRFLHTMLVVLVLFMASTAHSSAEIARYDSTNEIPDVLRARLLQNRYLEKYLAQMIEMIRLNAADYTTLTQSDLDSAKKRMIQQRQQQQLQQLIVYDTNHDTKVTKDEIKKTLLYQRRTIGYGMYPKLIEERIEQLMKLDTNSDGIVAYNEMSSIRNNDGSSYINGQLNKLLALSNDGKLTIAELDILARKAFATFDKNNNGVIEAEEMSTNNNALRDGRLGGVIVPNNCALKTKLPKNTVIYGSGAYGGSKLGMQIDTSGEEATSIELIINQPDKPVALLLGAHQPTIWNIRTMPGTKIVAVVIGGLYKQVLTGIDKTVPTTITSLKDKGQCGYFYFSKDKLRTINPIARVFFNQPVDMFYPAENGQAILGDKNYDLFKLSGKTLDAKEFRLKGVPLAGRLGLEEGVKNGFLRHVTLRDSKAWREVFYKKSPLGKALAKAAQDVPPVTQSAFVKPVPPGRNIITYEGYVVIKSGYTYPAGLSGIGTSFIVLEGITAPTGDPDGSTIYDMATGSCKGMLCPSE